MSDDETPRNETVLPKSEPFFTIPPIIAAIAGLMLVIYLAESIVLDEDGQLQLAFWFGFVPARINLPDAPFPGGWWPLLWTPFTHAFLHGGWDHVLLNTAWFLIFGTPVARRYGNGKFIAIFLVSALCGAVLFAAFTLPAVQFLIGASGAIAGLMGAAVRFIFQPLETAQNPDTGEVVVLGRRLATIAEVFQNPRARTLTILWLVLNVIVPLAPRLIGNFDLAIAWQAHLGGFLAGFLLVPLLEWQPKTQDPA